jgi:SAM-dependent methyltransferase
MNSDLTCLRDPETSTTFSKVGSSLNSEDGNSYLIIRAIPRFVPAENYSGDFGAQWNMFPKTQLDSYTGLNISESRLSRCVGGSLEVLRGKKILEAGSGAGRFTEILLKYGAIVHTFDYSNAVEANAKNNGENEELVIVQADIRNPPFPKADYDFVICLGVLQHTPSPEESIKSLWEMVKPNGALVVDHYLWKWRIVLPPPFGEAVALYRRFILKVAQQRRFNLVKSIINFWFPLHWIFRDWLFVQRILRRLSPVIFHYPGLKLRDRQMYYEWALLDTHDATTDVYKHRRTPRQIRETLEEVGATDIVVEPGGNGVEGFCRKPRCS